MKIQYQMTKERCIELQTFAFRKLSKRGKKVVIISLIAGGCFFISGFASIYSESLKCFSIFSTENWNFWVRNPSKFIITGGLFLVAIASFHNALDTPKLHLKRWVKKPLNQSIFLPQEIELDERGMVIKNSRGDESKISWEALGKIIQTEEAFFIEIQEERYFIIPKSELDLLSIEYLCDQFKQYKKDQYSVM